MIRYIFSALALLTLLSLPANVLAHGGGHNSGHHSSGYTSSSSSVHVSGYSRSDGTYVAPHFRTAPDATKLNNWSTKGNVNPYTGKAGTKDPY
jgi:hypothetical protein